MRAWKWLAVYLLLSPALAQAQDCKIKQYDSIPMTVLPDRLILPVELGEVSKSFALRLEDALSGISEETSNQLHLRRRSLPDNVGVGRNRVKIDATAIVPKFQLGKIKADDAGFLYLPNAANPEGVDGDIGMGFFEKMDFELDMAGGKLNLFSTDHCPGKVVYWTQAGIGELPFVWQKPGYIRLQMQLDGKPVRVAFRTFGRSEIGMNAVRRLFNLDENAPGMTVVETDGRGDKIYRYDFTDLTADALSIKHPAIFIRGEPIRPGCKDKLHMEYPDPPPLHSTEQPWLEECFGAADIYLGVSVLSKLRLYFSSKENVVYFTPAQAH